MRPLSPNGYRARMKKQTHYRSRRACGALLGRLRWDRSCSDSASASRTGSSSSTSTSTSPPTATRSSRDSYPLLDALAQALNDHGEIHTVRVEGHTDSSGDDAHNQDLSERRAASVAAYLRAAGVEQSLTPSGFGETRPPLRRGHGRVPRAQPPRRARHRRLTQPEKDEMGVRDNPGRPFSFRPWTPPPAA